MPKIQTTVPPNKPKPLKKTGSVLDRISDIEFDEDDGISILLYGQSGSGKTTCWATFPGPILAIIVSGGNKPGELRSINTPEYRKKIKTVSLETSDELLDLIKFQAETGTFKTIVLDHVSGAQDLCTHEVTGKPVAAQKSWGDVSQQQYGKIALKLKECLRDFLGLSCNRVIIGQERTFEGKEDNELITPTIGVALMPSVAGWLYPAVDYVCQTFKKQKTETVTSKLNGKEFTTTNKLKGVDYCLRIGPHEVYTTKFRVPKGRELPETIIDPSYPKLIKVING